MRPGDVALVLVCHRSTGFEPRAAAEREPITSALLGEALEVLPEARLVVSRPEPMAMQDERGC